VGKEEKRMTLLMLMLLLLTMILTVRKRKRRKRKRKGKKFVICLLWEEVELKFGRKTDEWKGMKGKVSLGAFPFAKLVSSS